MKTENTSKQDTTEARLIEACRSRTHGWENDLLAWIRINAAWLERRCISRLGSSADAEDAMQEIALKVLRSIGQFEGRSALSTWVTRIADNHCSTFLKQRAAKTMTTHLQHCIALVESDRFDTTKESSDQDVSVQHTLSGLTQKNRKILQLRFFSELSLVEIASVLGLSLSATKMRLYRAMDAFKRSHVIETLN